MVVSLGELGALARVNTCVGCAVRTNMAPGKKFGAHGAPYAELAGVNRDTVDVLPTER